MSNEIIDKIVSLLSDVPDHTYEFSFDGNFIEIDHLSSNDLRGMLQTYHLHGVDQDFLDNYIPGGHDYNAEDYYELKETYYFPVKDGGSLRLEMALDEDGYDEWDSDDGGQTEELEVLLKKELDNEYYDYGKVIYKIKLALTNLPASEENIPLLRNLASDKSNSIRTSLAHNNTLPPYIIKKLLLESAILFRFSVN